MWPYALYSTAAWQVSGARNKSRAIFFGEEHVLWCWFGSYEARPMTKILYGYNIKTDIYMLAIFGVWNPFFWYIIDDSCVGMLFWITFLWFRFPLF